MHKKVSAMILAGLLASSPAMAKEFLGLFTTEAVPGAKCKIVDATPKYRQGSYLGSRSDAFHKVSESLEVFTAEVRQDGFDAVIGFRPGVTGSIADDGNALFTWVYAGVAVKCQSK